ncbi:MAG: hypothetical protein F4Y37_02360 [Caldilineaceae bacterium SB0664_bin_22]|nr:hypothetical protein [Caldilineaceae bacterium SB0664_bin_22]MYC63986.1 hypothetical protein [Caldilineaceae bacterium SB0661_bin_34]
MPLFNVHTWRKASLLLIGMLLAPGPRMMSACLHRWLPDREPSTCYSRWQLWLVLAGKQAWSASQTRPRAPDFIGESFCAVHHEQPHWQQAYDRGQPVIFNIAGEPNRSLVETVCRANRWVLGSVRRPLDATSLAKIHDAYNETKAAYRRVME